MTYTSHGHHIPGTKMTGRFPPKYRCGGLALCPGCKKEAGTFHRHPSNAKKKDN